MKRMRILSSTLTIFFFYVRNDVDCISVNSFDFSDSTLQLNLHEYCQKERWYTNTYNIQGRLPAVNLILFSFLIQKRDSQATNPFGGNRMFKAFWKVKVKIQQKYGSNEYISNSKFSLSRERLYCSPNQEGKGKMAKYLLSVSRTSLFNYWICVHTNKFVSRICHTHGYKTVAAPFRFNWMLQNVWIRI